MKNSLPILLLASLVSLTAKAEPYGHIHLIAPDAQAAVQWYAKHFGGAFSSVPGDGPPINTVNFGEIPVIFFEREPSGGSVGSGVDHIGFSLINPAEVIAAVVADGGKQLGDLREFRGMQLGFVEDPWGTKIEIIDDPDLRGLHHIHLSSPNPEGTLAWYEKNFGGTTDRFADTLSGLRYGELWLLVAQAQGEVAPTQGRSLDHLGWNTVGSLDDFANTLKSNGVEFTLEPMDFRNQFRIAFVLGPDGVLIELVEF